MMRISTFFCVGALLLTCACQQQVQKIDFYTIKMEQHLQEGQRDRRTMENVIDYNRYRWYSPAYRITVHMRHPELEKKFEQVLPRYLALSAEASQSVAKAEHQGQQAQHSQKQEVKGQKQKRQNQKRQAPREREAKETENRTFFIDNNGKKHIQTSL